MPTIIFSHGKDSEPWGGKIVAMAEVARRRGLTVDSIDYRGMDDPFARVVKLESACKDLSEAPILVGSSMGGYVSAAVSSKRSTKAMFLLAPAFFMPGYEQYTPVPASCPIAIVHGWNDDIVPIENSIRFAQLYKSALHILDSDHRLTADIAQICELFDAFLGRVLADGPNK